MIGGENIFVQIDEFKLGKLKYYRGHTVQGAWVLGGVEDTAEKNLQRGGGIITSSNSMYVKCNW